MAALNSKVPGIRAQEKVVDTELEILKKEKDRFAKLVEEQAVSGKTLDDVLHQIDLAKARKSTFATQLTSLQQELKVIEAQGAVLQEQKRHCLIIAPVSGSVLNLVSRKGEMVIPGKPILKMADLENITLKAYITGDQISSVRVDQVVRVRIDGPDESFLEYAGVIYHVADQAEFTPKVIQTKKERQNMVYAVKVRVKNDGRIKMGMPGELLFK
jgi:HlyD family secretion protein